MTLRESISATLPASVELLFFCDAVAELMAEFPKPALLVSETCAWTRWCTHDPRWSITLAREWLFESGAWSRRSHARARGNHRENLVGVGAGPNRDPGMVGDEVLRLRTAAVAPIRPRIAPTCWWRARACHLKRPKLINRDMKRRPRGTI